MRAVWTQKDTGSIRLPSPKKSLLFHSQRSSVGPIILSTEHRGCQTLWIIIQLWLVFQWTSRIFICLSFCVAVWRRVAPHRRLRVAYIRELKRLCYFILLTQLGKQPTLALSIQEHGLERDPDWPAHTSISDKGSRSESGDRVKMFIQYMIKHSDDMPLQLRRWYPQCRTMLS